MSSSSQPNSAVSHPAGDGANAPQDIVIPPKAPASNIPFASSGAVASFNPPILPPLSSMRFGNPDGPIQPRQLMPPNVPILLPPPSFHDPRLSRPHTDIVVPPVLQPAARPYPFHGPLQAERLARADNAAAAKRAAEELKRAKQEEKAAERAAKEAKKVAEKEAREAKKKAKKEEKEAQKLADKQAKEAERAAAREGKARKKPNPTRGRRDPGDSDEEIGRANPGDVEQAAIRPIAREIKSRKWSDEESLKVVRHILSASVWPRFKVRQTIVFKEISEAILLGSKDWKQVASFWKTCWKKFKACRRRENHTGGGDGDEIALDDMREEVGSELEHDGAGSEDEAAQPVKKEPLESAQTVFTNAQLDRFEQSEIYKLLVEVAGNHPEVVKDEEFDSSRPFSDSEDEVSSRRQRKRRAESDTDADLAVKSYEIISASIASFVELRKANLELSNRRESREERVEEDRQESLKVEREHSRLRLEFEEAAHSREMRRIELEERWIRMEERDRRMREWDKAQEMLQSGIELLVAQGERMVRRLQSEEDELM